jgi:DNA-directed RNA polymerase beta subunit
MADEENENIIIEEVRGVSADIKSRQHATPDELVKMATQIWQSVKKSGVKASDDKGNDALLEKLQTAHHDFNLSFPIVIRWMVQRREFNAHAFRKYLLKHAHAKELNTRRGYLELQAEYLVLLYMETHPRYDTKAVGVYRDAIIAHLVEEDEEFERIEKEVKEEMAVREKEINEERQAVVYRMLINAKLEREKAAANAESCTIAQIVADPTLLAAAKAKRAAQAASMVANSAQGANDAQGATAAVAADIDRI